MGRTKKVGSAGSLGPRYGTVARKRFADVISGLRMRHECPSCHFHAVKRLSVGIWYCRKCGVKFTGGAYVPSTKLWEVSRRAAKAGTASMTLQEVAKTEEEKEEPTGKAPATRRRRRRKTPEDAIAPESSEAKE